MALAPVWQTMYEFYYTSNPLSGSSSSQAGGLSSFTGYYDFHFAKLDCVAFGDICKELKVTSYPNVRLFHTGVEVPDTMIKGHMPRKQYIDLIERTLESIKPGSRPRDGPKLPDTGADRSPDYNPSSARPSPTVAGSKGRPTVTNGVTLQRPQPTVNVQGISEPLTADTFANRVGNHKEPWFIKFYTPWCGHCRALAPNWEAMARALKDKLNIGEVNCDTDVALCRAAGISAFPTMMLFRGTDHVEYDGGRSTGDLIDFATLMADMESDVLDVSEASFTEVEKKSPVLFVYFYDDASTSEDTALLNRMLLHTAGHARVVRTRDRAIARAFGVASWPRLGVTRSGRKTLFPGTTPTEMRDVDAISEWMRTVRYPFVPEITASNAAAVMNDNIVVLTILSRSRPDEMAAIKKGLLDTALDWADHEDKVSRAKLGSLRTAKQDRITQAKSENDFAKADEVSLTPIQADKYANRLVQFAWVDGDLWRRWIVDTYGIDPVETGLSVVINDEKNRRFWDKAANGDPLSPSRSTLFETLPLVVTRPPTLRARSTRSGLLALFFNTRAMYQDRPVLKWWTVAAVLLFVVLVYRRLRRSHRAPFGFSGRAGSTLPGPTNGPVSGTHSSFPDAEKFSTASIWGRQPNGKVD